MRTKDVSLVIYVIFSVLLEVSIAFDLPLPWYWKGYAGGWNRCSSISVWKRADRVVEKNRRF